MPAYCRPAAFESLRRELPTIDTPIGLLRAAAALSLHAEPEHDLGRVAQVIEQLADAVRRRLQTDSQEAALAHLHDVLFDLIGFRGADQADYYNPANSYVPRVLERRRGIPITLALVYRTVATQLGLQAEGVNTPGHFLAAVTISEPTGQRTQYVDPFFGGGLLSRADVLSRIEQTTGRTPAEGLDLLAVATPVDWLRRMLHNLQAIFAHTNQQRDLLAMQELESLLPTAS